MQVTAKNIAALLNGTIEGNPEATVSRPGTIETGKTGEICFLGNPKYEHFAYTTEASVLLVQRDFQPTQPIVSTLIRVENVYESLALLTNHFAQAMRETQKASISERAAIDPSVKIGMNVQIADFVSIASNCVIGDNVQIAANVTIGKNTTIGAQTQIMPSVTIYPDTQIGANCIFHANAVIGSDGFGFAPQADGTYQKIQHLGHVIIEDNVEIGANATIDRGSIGATILRKGVKLDNLVHLAHNVEIGENTVIAAQTGIAGSTKIGKNCRFGGQVGIAGHLKIGDRVQVQAQTGIGSNIADDAKLYGSPSLGYTQYLRSYSIFSQLPDWTKRILALEKKVL